MDNMLKITHLLERHRDIALFVQAGPSFCCPSLVTEPLSERIQEVTGVPLVTLSYDGSDMSHEDTLVPYPARAGHQAA